MSTLPIRASYYRQFDADFDLDVPAEGYGGWKEAAIEIDPSRTAVVSMHAWDCGAREEYPGWYRAVEYIPRADEICRTVYPRLFAAIRASRMPLLHVVGGGRYYQHLPGYRRAAALAGPASPLPEQIEADPSLERLRRFRREHGYPGDHNREDIARGFARIDFPPEARPVGDEGVAEDGDQLFALCKEAGVNHLIYAGFAINWCLLLSPGGMADMSPRGLMCSAIRQAVTAVENRETARAELSRELGLWRVALAYGFVFNLDALLDGLGG